MEETLQKHIIDDYCGEQPVGTSFIIETGHPKHPFLAHTPTMRVPMPITHTDNVYLAMWAMLLAVRKHNLGQDKKNQSVACPGLGTATGRMQPDEAARQMAYAYRNYLFPPTLLSWPYARERQETVKYGGDVLIVPSKNL